MFFRVLSDVAQNIMSATHKGMGGEEGSYTHDTIKLVATWLTNTLQCEVGI